MSCAVSSRHQSANNVLTYSSGHFSPPDRAVKYHKMLTITPLGLPGARAPAALDTLYTGRILRLKPRPAVHRIKSIHVTNE